MTLINKGLATPSIRIDLAEEKKWSKGFESLNLDAWLVSEDKKVATNYFTRVAPEYMFEMQTAVQQFMWDISDDKENHSIDYFINSFKTSLQNAIGK